MTSPLPDPATPFGAKVSARLTKEMEAWLTVVASDGTPQPNPVAFLWNGDDSVLVYSRAGAARLTHLASNPRVAFSFNNRDGYRDVVVLTGTAERALSTRTTCAMSGWIHHGTQRPSRSRSRSACVPRGGGETESAGKVGSTHANPSRRGAGIGGGALLE